MLKKIVVTIKCGAKHMVPLLKFNDPCFLGTLYRQYKKYLLFLLYNDFLPTPKYATTKLHPVLNLSRHCLQTRAFFSMMKIKITLL